MELMTGSSNLTVEIDDMVCPESGEGHAFMGMLGCVEHGYAHLAGHYCIYCYRQVFYADTEAMCDCDIRLEVAPSET